MVLTIRDLVEIAPSNNTIGLSLGDGGFIACALEVVVLFDKEPVRFTLVGRLATHANEGPFALQLFAVQDELERAGTQCLIYIAADWLRLPSTLVPNHDSAAAILALGYDALEPAVFHGVVFHLDGEPLVRHDITGALGDRPAFEHAVPAESKIVVEM